MSEAALKEKEQEQIIDYDTMTDEEFNNQPIPEDSTEEAKVEPDDVTVETTVDEKDKEISTSSKESASVEDPGESKEESTTDGELTGNDSVEDKETEVKSTSIEDILKTPLKVGNTEITVNSVEELVTLAQRGLGANKRVQELAPKLKQLSMLESNGLLDQEKLNFLIALDKGDEGAIRKLVKSSGLDNFDLDVETGNEEYTAPDYSVDDSQYAIEQAFNEISTTGSYEDTLSVIQKFDDTSKIELQKEPNMIAPLNAHIADGSYEQIAAIVTKERALGNLTGLSDFSAYKHVWNVIQEHSASSQGTDEAGHKDTTNGQESKEHLAGTEGTQEAGHNASIGKQVRNAQEAAKAAAEVSNTNRGSQEAEIINFDDLTDEQLMDLDVNEIFK